MAEVDKEIGRLIRKAREHLQLSVEDIAEELGLPADLLLRLEHGEHRPTPNQLLSLSTVLRVQPAWFFPELRAGEDVSTSDLLSRVGLRRVENQMKPGESNRRDALKGMEIAFPGEIKVLVETGFDEVALRQIVAVLRD